MFGNIGFPLIYYILMTDHVTFPLLLERYLTIFLSPCEICLISLDILQNFQSSDFNFFVPYRFHRIHIFYVSVPVFFFFKKKKKNSRSTDLKLFSKVNFSPLKI